MVGSQGFEVMGRDEGLHMKYWFAGELTVLFMNST